ncbi:putative polynucleotide adenylyltransferase [Helianthus annuus]|uniref:polynucleotide adenylyltransferase n=1 Tax=Helianthus annuus TaxID=4232 RepID=A0A251TUT1_HELAN|nr:nuclear poly(A) polymerase 3 [Helianthus annuus]KAF5797017.1 putative polynucleotide adenylyltransferase [Helianthus annuus]KAJ0540252.1 putative polynucleotide adenylyltransferase [Helianthus annuus]KAJ0548744.1 putative polynucleotide adenylyltransferase [Helianthus annuus]KAJ0554997.1 putative polynucleotide adenylyltransferase [Helianthus annuus]KAJ0720565.1 putative polynucleotide adenylyltransferase [Helianthus annuus]
MVSQIELESSDSLLKFIRDNALLVSPEEQLRRRNLIDKLKQILMTWIRRVAYQRRLPQNQIKDASATLLVYGPYGLDVYAADSNIDAVCVVPCFASLAEDFFIVLYNMLAGRPEVSGIHCVKEAKVPLMQFTFDGILIDMAFAKLQVTAVPENVDISNPSFIKDIDENSWASLSGVRVKNRILQTVPDVKIFQELLQCVKSWAKRRGVYSDLFGLFGGIELAVLAAFVCMKNPSDSLVNLISIFFKTFAFWPWPEAVVVEDVGVLPPGTRALMPIQLPSSPDEYCHSNMTTSTFNKIRSEFRRGYRQTQDPFKPQFEWGHLFEPFPYSKSYLRFIKICVSTYNNVELGTWVHWVKSRFHTLLVKLEEMHALCDPNPTEYIDVSIQIPNIVFYWGLVPGRGDNLDLNTATNDFMTNLSIGYPNIPGSLSLALVQASQLPKIMQLATDDIKAQLRLSNFNYQQQMIPVYSTHSPHYLVGYSAT